MAGGGPTRCPECGSRSTVITDSRTRITENVKRRRRLCHSCGHGWTTLERPAGDRGDGYHTGWQDGIREAMAVLELMLEDDDEECDESSATPQ